MYSLFSLRFRSFTDTLGRQMILKPLRKLQKIPHLFFHSLIFAFNLLLQLPLYPYLFHLASLQVYLCKYLIRLDKILLVFSLKPSSRLVIHYTCYIRYRAERSRQKKQFRFADNDYDFTYETVILFEYSTLK